MLSIIVPVYNVAAYMKRGLDSVLASGEKGAEIPFEIVIVDDGSTDGSGELCDEYAAAYPNVRVYHKPNGGVSSARNMGLRESRGDMIAFMDPDDYVDPGFYQALAARMAESGADMVFGSYVEETDTRTDTFEEPRLAELNEMQFPQSVFLHQGKDGQRYTCCFMRGMYRKAIIDRGSMFREGIKLGEDILFMLEYMSGCKSYESMRFPSGGYHYYRREGSATLKIHMDEFAQNQLFIGGIEQFLSGCECVSSQERETNLNRYKCHCARLMLCHYFSGVKRNGTKEEKAYYKQQLEEMKKQYLTPETLSTMKRDGVPFQTKFVLLNAYAGRDLALEIAYGAESLLARLHRN